MKPQDVEVHIRVDADEARETLATITAEAFGPRRFCTTCGAVLVRYEGGTLGFNPKTGRPRRDKGWRCPEIGSQFWKRKPWRVTARRDWFGVSHDQITDYGNELQVGPR